jgi:hypothetical protein
MRKRERTQEWNDDKLENNENNEYSPFYMEYPQ